MSGPVKRLLARDSKQQEMELLLQIQGQADRQARPGQTRCPDSALSLTSRLRSPAIPQEASLPWKLLSLKEGTSPAGERLQKMRVNLLPAQRRLSPQTVPTPVELSNPHPLAPQGLEGLTLFAADGKLPCFVTEVQFETQHTKRRWGIPGTGFYCNF